jgi:hypothetical protein
MEVALAKNPNLRTRTVGELADGFGRAYGLSGDHLSWAYTPEAILRQTIQAELPRMLAAKPAAPMPMGAMADPFAQAQGYPAPVGVPKTLPDDDDFVMGVPKASPRWLLPAIIGALAVIVGVVGAVAFLR